MRTYLPIATAFPLLASYVLLSGFWQFFIFLPPPTLSAVQFVHLITQTIFVCFFIIISRAVHSRAMFFSTIGLLVYQSYLGLKSLLNLLELDAVSSLIDTARISLFILSTIAGLALGVCLVRYYRTFGFSSAVAGIGVMIYYSGALPPWSLGQDIAFVLWVAFGAAVIIESQSVATRQPVPA